MADNLLTKSTITNCTNGCQPICGSKIDKLTLTEKQFSAPEFVIETQKNVLQIEKIPVVIE